MQTPEDTITDQKGDTGKNLYDSIMIIQNEHKMNTNTKQYNSPDFSIPSSVRGNITLEKILITHTV